MVSFWVSLLSLASVVNAVGNIDCTSINGIKKECRSLESFYQRDVFWVGGKYNSEALGMMTYDQFYVEKLTGLGGVWQNYPVVFFHGGGVSGATWLNTPDNRKGMASMFLDKGYQVYIVDQSSVGRGSQNDLTGYPLRFGSTSNITEKGFTHPEGTNAYPQSQLHTQWPGAGLSGDPVFDAFESGFIPLTSNATRQEMSMRAGGCELLNLIGKSFLVSHSIGAIHSILMSDECPDLVAGNVNLEPGNIPFESYVGNATSAVGRTTARPFGLTSTNLHYSPPITSASELVLETVGEDLPEHRSCIQQSNATGSIIHTLPNLAKIPYVSFIGEASPHASYAHCVIQYLQQVGVKPDFVRMEDRGVKGNAHFGYLELNSQTYFEVVEKWIVAAICNLNGWGSCIF
ncbi:hypothetical protein HYALB_00001849 [Hymenoscyphus albidus]|uniref:Alpha/beta-hydrolase n=1 Tax=Hymenoscyphus albidus TaxID=595503 RepID=A0A9N9PX02_9HELO|nr:hypothetical protein HYALB_00001849 [Hymenoscyphus albidus]